MPFASNAGVRIHYEVEGVGPNVVLQHGVGGSLENWRDVGIVRELSREYRVILIDARGHGASDKPHTSDFYTPELIAGDVVAVLDAARVASAHYWGYSMGAVIGYRAIARHCLDRFHTLVLGGAGAYNDEKGSGLVDGVRRIYEVGAEQGMETAIALLERTFGPQTRSRRARLLASDPRAFVAVMKTLSEWSSALEDLSSVRVPCFVYAGDTDPVYEAASTSAQRLPNATFLTLTGLGHGEVFSKTVELVLPRVMEFLTAHSPA